MSLVKLISVTPDAEQTILYCARVSSDQSNESTGLLRYLIRNKHWSPFELAHMTVEIETSRAISQQITRHRSFSFQEFSQRYAEVSPPPAYPGRRQAEQNRQSSVDDLDTATQAWWMDEQDKHTWNAYNLYHEAIERGIAKECARFVLPLSTDTKLYMCGSVRSWIHYLQLRLEEHTQLEHREVAEQVSFIFEAQFPTISEAVGLEGLRRMGVQATPV